MFGILRLEFYMKIQTRAGKTYACVIEKAGKTQTFAKKKGWMFQTQSLWTPCIMKVWFEKN